MKKFLMLIVALLMVFTLSACGNNEEEDENDAVKKTVIKYCNWNFGTEEDNNLLRRKIEKFNKESKTIRIEMIVPVDGNYDDFLTTLASGGDLPDVFMVNSVPTAIINKWALDITDLAKADSEWNNIPKSLRDSISYNDHIYAIPAGQYYMGLFANYDLIDNYLTGSQSAEEKFATGEFTTAEWIETVKAMRDINKTDGTGIIGMNAVGDMINWLPSSLDETGKTKHFVWNGSKFDFASELMLDSLQTIADLGDPTAQYVFSAIPATITVNDVQQEYSSVIFGSGNPADVFLNGQMGFIQEGSWASTYENTDFNCSFISYPDAKVTASTDFLCISRSTKNKEAAFEVAKYMTYGEVGLKATFNIIDENPDAKLSLTGLPLNTTQELSDKWFTYIKMKGLKETFDKVAKNEIDVIVEGNKTIPGFLKARYTFNTGISFEGVRGGALLTIGDFIWDVCGGDISINDYTAKMTKELCDKINEEVKKDYEAMGLEYKG